MPYNFFRCIRYISECQYICKRIRSKVYVIDSKQFCISYYILVEQAVRLRDQGKSAKEIADEIASLTSRARVLSIFDTLEYLKIGGRLSSTAAFVGEMLSIKPAITITDGVVEVFGKVRGAKKGIATIIAKDASLRRLYR